MASSSSPLKSIANCVKRVLDWGGGNRDEEDNESLSSPIKECQVHLKRTPMKLIMVDETHSRSVSPEIPKLEEPTQYVYEGEASAGGTDENMDPNSKKKKKKKKRSINQVITPTSMEVGKPETKKVRRGLDDEDTIVGASAGRRKSVLEKLQIDGEPGLLTSTSSPRLARRASSRVNTPQKVIDTPTKSSRNGTPRKSSRQATPLKATPKTIQNDDNAPMVRHSSRSQTTPSKLASQFKESWENIKGSPSSTKTIGSPVRQSSRSQTPSKIATRPLSMKKLPPASDVNSSPTKTPLNLRKTPLRTTDQGRSATKPSTGTPSRSKAAATPSSSRKRLKYTKTEESDSEGFSPTYDEGADDSFDDFVAKKRDKNAGTPKKRRSVAPVASAQKDTPTSRRRRTMTPCIPSRSIPLPKVISSLEEAQLRLHVAAVPDSLPCREDEFAEILSFTEGKIFDGTGGCMYISGVPGTGKTATVKEVIRTLQDYSDAGDLPSFNFIEINGMRLTEPNQTYAQLWKALTGAKVTTEHAKNLLEKRFTSANSTSAKKCQTSVVLVDELDLLWNRKQSVLYNIFEWPTNKYAKLVVLAIANTMDLPERVMINRVSSRIGLTRLTFSPYTHHQLQEIVTARLTGLSVFDKDAIQLVSRKVASLSGDARRALDICRRATEIAQSEGPQSLVGITHVTEAHKEMFCSPKIMAIRCCSKYERYFMQSMVAVFQKTGIEEATFDRVLLSMTEVLQFEDLTALTVDEAHNIVGRLQACRLILSEPGKTGRLDAKLRLNVSQDDVLFALKNEDQ